MSIEYDFDLKKSKFIGELYPVLKDARGNIIDGNHRLQADPNWEARIVPNVINDETLIIARLVANWQRRQVTPQEKAEWINGLAEIYHEQGYKTLIGGNEIVWKIVEVTGLSQPTVNKYLDDKYKVFTDKDRVRKPEISTHERIKHKFGEEFVNRHENEVVEKLLGSKLLVEVFSDKAEKKTTEDEVKLYDATAEKIREHVVEVQKAKIISEPVSADNFVPKAELTVERICDPLERFTLLDSSILSSLNSGQKERVLAVLFEARKRIDEMVKALQDNK